MKSNGIKAGAMRFFKDSKGKVVIWQRPNIPLIGWILFKLMSIVSPSDSTKGTFENLSTAFIFTWAYLEIISGKSYFRRVLGGAIMIGVLISYF